MVDKYSFNNATNSAIEGALNHLAMIANSNTAKEDIKTQGILDDKFKTFLNLFKGQLSNPDENSALEAVLLKAPGVKESLHKIVGYMDRLGADPDALASAIRSKDFLSTLKSLVLMVTNAKMDEGYLNRLETQLNMAGTVLSGVSSRSLHSPGDASTHLASDLELAPAAPAAPEAPETPAPVPTTAETMMGSIEALVRDLESFIENVPVTAFHDRDADKVARARSKASELRDDILLIRKQVSDTQAALNGETPQAERFATMARSVLAKFVGHA